MQNSKSKGYLPPCMWSRAPLVYLLHRYYTLKHFFLKHNNKSNPKNCFLYFKITSSPLLSSPVFFLVSACVVEAPAGVGVHHFKTRSLSENPAPNSYKFNPFASSLRCVLRRDKDEVFCGVSALAELLHHCFWWRGWGYHRWCASTAPPWWLLPPGRSPRSQSPPPPPPPPSPSPTPYSPSCSPSHSPTNSSSSYSPTASPSQPPSDAPTSSCSKPPSNSPTSSCP